MSKPTIWCATDRQGTKYFTERPEFIDGHDIFDGHRIRGRIDLIGFRIMRKYKAPIRGTRKYVQLP